MRVIEQKMIAAIHANVTDKTIGNTRVHAIIGGHEVQLHGNIIAHVDASRGSVRFTLAGWPTPTTRSRINALLREFKNNPQLYHGVGQEGGRQFYRTWPAAHAVITKSTRREISATEWVQA